MSEDPQYDWQREDYRSFDIGETLSRAFRLFKNQFWDAFKIGVLLILGPSIIINAASYLLATDPDGLTLALIVFGLIMLVVGSIYYSIGLIIVYVRRLWGEQLNLSDAIRQGAPRFWPYFGASLLAGLGLIAGAFALIVPAFILLCGWYVLAPVVVGEKLGATDSLGRSWLLTSGYKWQIFALLLIYIVIAFFAGAALGLLIMPFIGADAIQKLPEAELNNVLVFSFIESLAGVVTTIFSTALVASIYYELLYLKREID